MLMVAAVENLARWSIPQKGVVLPSESFGEPRLCTLHLTPPTAFSCGVWKMPGQSQGEFLLYAP